MARVILELARELDAIEIERRQGRLETWELVDRCLSVWLGVKQVDKHLQSPDPQD